MDKTLKPKGKEETGHWALESRGNSCTELSTWVNREEAQNKGVCIWKEKNQIRKVRKLLKREKPQIHEKWYWFSNGKSTSSVFLWAFSRDVASMTTNMAAALSAHKDTLKQRRWACTLWSACVHWLPLLLWPDPPFCIHPSCLWGIGWVEMGCWVVWKYFLMASEPASESSNSTNAYHSRFFLRQMPSLSFLSFPYFEKSWYKSSDSICHLQKKAENIKKSKWTKENRAMTMQ